jgi:hypothetical protein
LVPFGKRRLGDDLSVGTASFDFGHDAAQKAT